MTTQANQMNSTIANNFDGLRFGRAAVKQCARTHGCEIREKLGGAILAYSPGWQGIFF
jgi:hypothetical protein